MQNVQDYSFSFGLFYCGYLAGVAADPPVVHVGYGFVPAHLAVTEVHDH